LPDPSLITHPGKIEDMISISSYSLCGEDDFLCARLTEDGLSAAKAGGKLVKAADMLRDMGSYRSYGKFIIQNS
jgi:hypothetical protein